MRIPPIVALLALAALMSHPMSAYASDQITGPDGEYLTPDAAFVYDAYVEPCSAWLSTYTFFPPSGIRLLTGSLDPFVTYGKTDPMSAMKAVALACMANPDEPVGQAASSP